jgi:1,4-dihydroxy-2-naphthoate polyprenyltransferase
VYPAVYISQESDMEKRDKIKAWMGQIRSNFLLLSVMLVAVGTALAAVHMKRYGIGSFSVVDALLVTIGVIIAHASVNLFNEYSDSRTGIDNNTKRTPFSGGTGLIQSGATTPEAVITAAWQTLLWAFLIGLYFTIMSHWVIGFIMLVGGLSIVLYTRHLARVLLGEFFAGLSLGSLVVIGAFIAMVGRPSMNVCTLFPAEVVLLSIPPGILTALLLYLNEFPDMEADRQGGRFHLVIWLGRQKAAYLYAFGLFATYATILLPALLGVSSWWVMLGFLTLPLAVKAGVTAVKYPDDMTKIVPAMGINVIVVLATDFLLAVGLVLELIFAA